MLLRWRNSQIRLLLLLLRLWLGLLKEALLCCGLYLLLWWWGGLGCYRRGGDLLYTAEQGGKAAMLLEGSCCAGSGLPLLLLDFVQGAVRVEERLQAGLVGDEGSHDAAAVGDVAMDG